MREGGVDDGKGMVSDVEGLRNLGGREMFSSMGGGISVCLVVVVLMVAVGVVVLTVVVRAVGVVVLTVVVGVVVLMIVVGELYIGPIPLTPPYLTPPTEVSWPYPHLPSAIHLIKAVSELKG